MFFTKTSLTNSAKFLDHRSTHSPEIYFHNVVIKSWPYSVKNISLKNLVNINTPFWLVNTIHCLLFILFLQRKYCLIRFWCKATSHWFWNSCQILALKPKSFDFEDLFLSPENTILLDVKKASIFKNLLCSLVLYFLSASKLLVVLSGSSSSEGIFYKRYDFYKSQIYIITTLPPGPKLD